MSIETRHYYLSLNEYLLYRKNTMLDLMTPVVFLSNQDTGWVLLKGNTQQDRFHVVLGFSYHHRPSELGVVLAKGHGQQ